MAQEKIFLTGGTGFVGSHVAERLTELGKEYVCAIRPERAGLSWIEPLSPPTVRVDLTDRAGLRTALSDIDTVIHVAGVTKASRRDEYKTGNVDTTDALISAACDAGVKRFCFVSSLTAVGPNPDGIPLVENASCHPITTYGMSKREAEIRVLAAKNDIEVTILRPPAVYGPRDKDVLEFFLWASRGLKPLLGRTRPRLSIIHVQDLARAIVEAASHPRTAGETYFVTDPVQYSYGDIFDFLSEAAQKRLRNLYIPVPLLHLSAWLSEMVSAMLPSPLTLNREKLKDVLQPYWTCSSERLTDHTGFRTGIGGAEGFRSTYAWYKQMGWIR
jgi:nucleoside-diphosphate-sugar epimerase